MNFEPQKLFIGLIDFFAILLPGALLTFLVKDFAKATFPGYANLPDTQGWVAFLFSSYLLGHFIFLIGSWLIDDRVYDPIRKATYGEQITRLAKGERLSPFVRTWLAARLFKKDSELAVRHAVKIKEYYLDPLKARDAINAFQWSKAKLTLEHPEAMVNVERFEADSKFFRSLVVLCILVIVLSLLPFEIVKDRQEIVWVSVVVLVLAFWRYKDQRLKATKQAYWYILTLESKVESTFRLQVPKANLRDLSHAGGVVYRSVGDRVEYLLVQAKDTDEWVLPKGHIERHEDVKETAVREVREETGVWARVRSKLDVVSFLVEEKPIKVQFYLMEAVDADRRVSPTLFRLAIKIRRWLRSEIRESVWLPLDQAKREATHPESKSLLKLAEERRTQLERTAPNPGVNPAYDGVKNKQATVVK